MNAFIVDAIYEKGVLKPATPLPLKENEKVRIAIQSPLDIVAATSGLIGWTGDDETVERIALDPEFGVMESP